MKILLVEDDQALAAFVRRSFERDGGSFELTIAATPADGVRAMANGGFDLVISEWRLLDGEGLGLLKEQPRCPLLIMDGQGNQQITAAAIRAAEGDVSERNLRLLADAMPQIVWTAAPDGRMDYCNRRWYEFTGFTENTVGDKDWKSVLHPEDFQVSRQAWAASVNSGRDYEVECRFRDRKTNDFRWYLVRAQPLRDERGTITKWVGTSTDIDDGKRLRQSLAEKTMLLQEVHHRVKNNLQVVCSLLSMQIAGAGVPACGALEDAHSRVLAMSLIHEQLYQSNTLADLNFGEYIEALADRLFTAYCVDPSRIRLELNVDLIDLDANHAIPCGLILNELLSNSLKHAFRDGRAGAIRVSLKKTGKDHVELTVADDGNGLPVGFRLEEARSLGLLVVRTLTHQLRADVSITSDAGAMFRFGWKLAAPAREHAIQ
jgi:PAS domain S-box-containing protein